MWVANRIENIPKEERIAYNEWQLSEDVLSNRVEEKRFFKLQTKEEMVNLRNNLKV